MAPIRVCAIIALVMMAVEGALLVDMLTCSNVTCQYPLILAIFLPAGIALLALVTGIVATAVAWRARHVAWTIALLALTVLGPLDLLASAIPALSPHLPSYFHVPGFLPLGSALAVGLVLEVVQIVILPIVALIYSFVAAPARRPAT